ncbi:winged helix-turn-helix domain-containing protein [Actinophytocola sp.]|uniref:winged helix-turn-helix domain-containing protein n=1 Tax=Actinophytocola sp. TaxID=1872138 RepID=UPI002D459DC0|nr:crosslink repair DNA glycosylase YcaQ family protein [Actinophytocola sp.]HYQ65858.1 crosslink repair DNA glycosylase YcaQ family protein [Actinophytocola sp.]
MAVSTTLSADVARRVALGAQGFTDARPGGEVSRRHLRRVLDRVRLIQLDSVNVAVRAHYMPLFSRLGPYPADLVDDAAWTHRARRPRMLVEYWAHEASLLPVEDWPLFRWRMREYERKYAHRFAALRKRSPGLFDDVLAAVKELGPIGAGPLEDELGLNERRARKAPGGWWNRSDVKHACEWLFATGELTTGTRRGFQRLYDLPERVLPPEVLSAPPVSDAEAARQLMLRAASAHGIGTEPDLRDYYRLPPERSKAALSTLVEQGLVEAVTVHGWQHPAYRHVDARTPRKVTGRALLAPFDPLIWRRERTERIFDFHYRIEIYVPEPKRVYGYYVFPFLLDGQLVGRVDLKTDRMAGVLRAKGVFTEPGVDKPHVARELAAELRTMATWLGLNAVELGPNGNLTKEMRTALKP